MVVACIELFPAWNCMAKSDVISAARIIEINNENSKNFKDALEKLSRRFFF